MAHHLLVVPIQLDVLRVDEELGVAGPLYDFTRLPWANSPAHRNSPYLGETLATGAFEDQHQLQRGLHCHWSLPLALTKTSSTGLTYRQSFHSVFGRAAAEPGQLSGDEIWRRLVAAGWLEVVDERAGVALARLPDQAQQDTWLQSNLPAGYAFAVRKLLLTPDFPPVPNRWLLNRLVDGTVTSSRLIESDYLWPEGQDRLGDELLAERHTVYPVLTGDPAEQPYRYLGRDVAFGAAVAPAEDTASYLDGPLTAIGYGEPAFAAFYPICRSVFGHYDATLPQRANEEIELIGVYTEAGQDYFRLFIDAFRRQWQDDHQTTGVEGIHRQHRQLNFLYLDLLDAVYRQLRLTIPVMAPREALEKIAPDEGAPAAGGAAANAWSYLQEHRWIDDAGRLLPKAYGMTAIVGAPYQTRAEAIRRALNGAIEQQMPERLVCYARVACPTEASPLPAVDNDQIELAVGNSATEALSALLAGHISPSRKATIEDQLEAIQFAAVLQHTTVDTGPIFDALRHEKQFQPVPGGQHWVVKTTREESKEAGQVAEDEELTVPAAVGDPLNRLNHLEGEKQRNDAAIGSLRRQIYADWCWYLKLAGALKGPQPQFPGGSGRAFGTRLEDEADEPYRRIPFGTRVRQFAEAEPAPEPSPDDNPYTTTFLAAFKAFIADEIETQLAALLQREAALDAQLSAQHSIVQEALMIYQAEAQFLLESDIVDWAAFTTGMAAKALALGFAPALPPAGNRVYYLLAINQRVLDLPEPVAWPDAAPSGEYRALLAALRAGGAGDALRVALRLRAGRLALEATFPGQIRRRAALELSPRAASRFWRPNDPVVFVSGFDASSRHQQPSEALPATLAAYDNAQGDALAPLFTAAQAAKVGVTPTGDWQPLFLSWDVAFSQAHQPEDETYGPDYLRRHYRLGNTDIEPAGRPIAYESPAPFYGRSILTPGAGIALKQTLIDRLVPVLYRQFLDQAVPAGQSATVALFNTWLRGHIPEAGNLPLDDTDLADEQEIKQWLADELDRQTAADGQLLQHLLAYLQTDSHQPIIRQYLAEPGAANLAGDIDHFLTWAEARTHLKAAFAAGRAPKLDEPLDIALIDREEVRAAFVSDLRSQLGAGLSRYYEEMKVAAGDQAGYLEDHYNEVIAWYQPQVSEAMYLVVEIRALQTLLTIRGLAQAFSGFGDALVMRHQALQLPVYDPFPYDGDHVFTAKVRAAVQTANTVAPAENLPFAPWRAGKMALGELELLDNFGRYWPSDDVADLEAFTTRASDTMPDVGETAGREFAIPPRLAQGARLGFRWLASHVEIEEINDRPASNPICGWVVANHLDDSLTIYASDGGPLGSIDEAGHWRTFPGNRGPVLPADIANPHLARMVQWLCDQGPDFLADFLSTLDIAHENMAPESYAQYESTALLMGHPLALVRADVSIEMHEPPAIDVSRLRVQADVQAYYRYQSGDAGPSEPPPPRPQRHTHNFEQVEIPLRLGEFHRLNDGLVGYWVEDGRGGYAGDTFYAPQTSPTPGLSERIRTRHQAGSEDRDESDFLLYLAPDSEPLKLTFLLDPRAPIHATAGVVPVEALYVASDQYLAALQRLQVAFLTAPVLAPELGLELSLPTEPGYEWRWIQRDGEQWSSISAEGIIGRHQLQEAFGAGAGPLWTALLQQGWLSPLGDDTARMVAEDERAQPDLPPPFDAAQEAVELLFHRLRVRPFDPAARFDGNHQLREGWLRLSPGNT